MSRGPRIGADDIIPRHLRGGVEAPSGVTLPAGATLADARRQLVLRTFASTGGDVERAAKAVGVPVEEARAELAALIMGKDGSRTNGHARPAPAAPPAKGREAKAKTTSKGKKGR